MLKTAWETDGTALARSFRTIVPVLPAGALDQLRDAQKAIANIYLPAFNASEMVAQALSAHSAMTRDLFRNLQFLEAASAATIIARSMEGVNESLRSITEGYVRAAKLLSPPQIDLAFLGTQNLLASLDTIGPDFSHLGVIASLLGDSRPAIGSLALGIDLQLSPAIAAALTSRPGLQGSYLRERTSWQRWLPQHPGALTRSDTIETDWLIGETHNASQATVAALGRHAEGVDEAEVSAALEGVAYDYPDLLSMEIPGTGVDLRTYLTGIDPDIANALQGGVNRLRDGGPDSARQAAASLRAGLDKLADRLVPGGKRDRAGRYAQVLGVDVGDPDGTLIYHQIWTLDASFHPLGKAVHDQLEEAAVKAIAFGLFGALVGVLSRWARSRPDHKL
jgi:hypothetical protein